MPLPYRFPTSGHDDNGVYQQLQTPTYDSVVGHDDVNLYVERDAHADWEDVCEPSCDAETNERGLRLKYYTTLSSV